MSPASAADRGQRSADTIAQLYAWAGFYVGVNAGYGVGESPTAATFGVGLNNPSAIISPAGGFFGGQLGYNWQRANLLLGVETDLQAADLRERDCTFACAAKQALRARQTIDWFGTARIRIGLVTGPAVSYITGGLAYGGVEHRADYVTGINALPVGTSDTKLGWAVGSGVEAALGGNWSAKIEYLYLDLGEQSLTDAPSPLKLATFENRQHLFRAGVNYRVGGMGSPAPLQIADWRGFYAGLSAGYGVARNESSWSQIGSSEQFDLVPRGFIGGGQFGYNWQNGNWLFGFETDLQVSTMRDDRNCLNNCYTPDGLFNADQRLQWFGTVRGRLGYSVGSSLFYGTGGLAFGRVKTDVSETFNGGFLASFSDMKTGWAAGGGIERPFEFFGMFGPNWTIKTEYMLVDLGSTAGSYTNYFDRTFVTHVREHIWRSALNFHFN